MLSSTFHRRLARLLFGRAIIDNVNASADPTHSLDRSRGAWPQAVRTVAVIVATAALAVSAAGCGGSQRGPASTSSTQSAAKDAALAFSRCMRSHGVPNFPDPDPQGNVPPFQADVSKEISIAANDTCKHLLPNGGGGGLATRGDQQKVAFALKVARCMRSHGFSTYPDPNTSSQGSGTRFSGTGIDTKSPHFQTAETGCEQQSRKALGLP